jgi:hypothetical protein
MLLLTATGITFSRGIKTADVPITVGGIDGRVSQVPNLIDPSDTAVKYKYSTGDAAPYTPVTPDLGAVVDGVGSINAGDVYYIDTVGYSGNILVTLYVTNQRDLFQNYTDLDLSPNVREGESGNWSQSVTAGGDTIAGVHHLTFVNDDMSLILQGGTCYCISIDDGHYVCVDPEALIGSVLPTFYLEVRPN